MATTRQTAATTISTLASFTGIGGAIIGGVIAGKLLKAPDLDMYQTNDPRLLGDNVFDYQREKIRVEGEAAKANTLAAIESARAQQSTMVTNMEVQKAETDAALARAGLAGQRQLVEKQEQEAQAKLRKQAVKAAEGTVVGAYTHVEVTPQLLPDLVNMAVTAKQANAPAEAIPVATVTTAPIDYQKYLPYVVGGILLLSLVMTGKKGKK